MTADHEAHGGPAPAGVGEQTRPGGAQPANDAATVDSDFGRPSYVARAVWLGALAMATALLIVETLGFNSWHARRAPLFTLTFIAVMLAIQIGVLAFKWRRGEASPVPPAVPIGRREWLFVAWVLFLILAVYAVGAYIGTVTFIALYLLVARPLRPVGLGILIVTAAVALHVIFIELLNVHIRSGWLL